MIGLCSGAVHLVHGLEGVQVVVGVNLSGVDVDVAEYLLDDAVGGVGKKG
jgi:hypothetical protein